MRRCFAGKVRDRLIDAIGKCRLDRAAKDAPTRFVDSSINQLLGVRGERDAFLGGERKNLVLMRCHGVVAGDNKARQELFKELVQRALGGRDGCERDRDGLFMTEQRRRKGSAASLAGFECTKVGCDLGANFLGQLKIRKDLLPLFQDKLLTIVLDSRMSRRGRLPACAETFIETAET